MIRINPIPPAPPALTEKDCPARKERKAACAYWKVNKTMKGFKFEAYGSPEVRAALEKAFHGKCAYCECRYDSGAPCDVEHYRPKGGVAINGKLEEPGYYWLAAEWTNLLPSCIDCNRKRYHEFPEDGIEARGKANLFPIDGKKRATAPGKEHAERRLLLHPYFDDPSEYIRFVDDGVIQALADHTGAPKKMAMESIRVYGLDRPRLTSERRFVWIRIASMVKRAKRDVLMAEANPGDLEAQEAMLESISDLKRELSERGQFLGMARQVVRPIADLL